MNILFVHQNFPGQFVHLAAALAEKKGNRVVALGMHKQLVPKGVDLRLYTLLRSPATETHPFLRDEEAKILRAEACASAAMALRKEGFTPDVIVAHPGWGEAMFIKDVFPTARLVVYCEFYYAADGQDVGFDPEDLPLTFSQRCQIRLKNTANLHSVDIADAAISPTQWQKSTYPKWAQEKITVIHDGIDFERLKHNPKAQVRVGANQHHLALTFKYGDEVLTYVARNLEPVRGFKVFMRTLPEVLRRRPRAHVLIVGGDDISYGFRAPGGASWKQHMLNEVGDELDMQRVHFLGRIPYETYVDVLHVSKVHAYWTMPFVLSWSFLEAVGSGVPLVTADTPPVHEFIGSFDFKTVPFFAQDEFCVAMSEGLGRAKRAREVKSSPALDIAICTKAHMTLISAVA